MAGRTRLLAALVALATSGAACSSANGEVDLSSVTVSTTATTATVTTSPTTTVATTTTLSERAIAEAEVEQLVIDFWLAPFDTSKNEFGAEYLTGLIARRSEEFVQSVTDAGEISRNQGQESIEVIRSQVDLDKGEGEVKACTGESGERLDAETMERIKEPNDPEYLTTAVFYLELTPDGWKISELVGSSSTASPEICEITKQ